MKFAHFFVDRPIFAGVFGLVHGAGFANYLKALFVDRLAVPLFGFNVGIEMGQVVVLGVVALVFFCVDRTIARVRATDAAWQPLSAFSRDLRKRSVHDLDQLRIFLREWL